MKRAYKYFALITALFTVLCAFWNCRPAAETPENSPSVSDGPTAPPVSDEPTASPTEAPTAQPGVPSSLDAPAERNEIKVMLPFGPEANNVYSYRFKELPAYDAAQEDSYTFADTRIRLCVYQDLGVGFFNHIYGRNVCEEADHSYVSGVIAHLDFEEYSIPPEAGEWLINVKVLLFITIEGRDGAGRVYAVGDDLRVLRADEAYRNFDGLPTSAITAISTEPLKDEDFRHLIAMSLHYMEGEVFVAGLMKGIENEYHDVKDGTTLEIAFGETKRTFTEKNEIEELLESGRLFEVSGLAMMRTIHECLFDFTEGAVKVTLKRQAADTGRDETVERVFYIMPDGTLAVQLDGIILGAGNMGTRDYFHYATAVLNRVCFSTRGKFSFDEWKALITD